MPSLRSRSANRSNLSALTALTVLSVLSACQPAPRADTIVFGKTWTGDSAKPWVNAVAIAGDTVMATGDSAELARLAGKDTKLISASGGLVVPGLSDQHTHFLSGGYQLSSVDLRDAASPQEFVKRIKDFATERKPGEWILGGDWDHEKWPGSPLPRKEWIDSVTPHNPVFISRLDGHMALANSLALKAAGISKSSPEVAGGTIVRDPRTHEPTGVLKDNAQDAVYGAVPETTAEQDDAALRRAMEFVASKGVTAVSAVSASWGEVAAFKRARAAGHLTVRVSLYPALADWKRVADTLKADGAGDDWIRVAGVKGFMDGSLGSTTAWFFEPYTDDPTTSGLSVTPVDSMKTWIFSADSAGLQVVVHAIGERANATLIDIYDSVARAHGPRDRRFRIEHAQHLRPADVERMGHLDIIASMQPYHAIDDGRWAEKRLGPVRIHDAYVFRSLLDHHVHLDFGSDWTVAPIDPILGIYAAVTRRTLDGKNPGGWLPDQKISVEEALRSYTSENAYGVFAEKSRGRLTPGRKADLAIIDKDLSAIPAETIDQATIRLTMVGGKVVFQAH
ncbi:MAG TPA: amidohydrolase [Gemmatimonadales bacterium]|nr:amidohydrolase [Gemmatimonadales bacterium]